MIYVLAALFFFFGGVALFYFNFHNIKDLIELIKKEPKGERTWFLILLEAGTLTNLSGAFWGLVFTLIGIGIPVFFIVAMFF
ncbi:hypothetical protein [Priestia abyssalis]|uniref:hypothetical protein n=1 Tax=Priestia abyssalis TaxID=1221450 RepID=UPI0009953D5F|nr:hypothetical protein [Priestia abyssalis]